MEYGQLDPMNGTSNEEVSSETLAAIRELMAEQDTEFQEIDREESPPRQPQQHASTVEQYTTPERSADVPRGSLQNSDAQTEVSGHVRRRFARRRAVADALDDASPSVVAEDREARKTIFERLFGK